MMKNETIDLRAKLDQNTLELFEVSLKSFAMAMLGLIRVSQRAAAHSDRDTFYDSMERMVAESMDMPAAAEAEAIATGTLQALASFAAAMREVPDLDLEKIRFKHGSIFEVEEEAIFPSMN